MTELLSRLKRLEEKSKKFVRPQFLKDELGISYFKSLFLLKLAVKAGMLEERVVVYCPTCGRRVATLSTDSKKKNYECFATSNCEEFEQDLNLKEVERVFVYA